MPNMTALRGTFLDPTPYMTGPQVELYTELAEAEAATARARNHETEVAELAFPRGTHVVKVEHGRAFVLEVVGVRSGGDGPRVRVENPKTGSDYWTDANGLVGPFDDPNQAESYALDAASHNAPNGESSTGESSTGESAPEA